MSEKEQAATIENILFEKNRRIKEAEQQGRENAQQEGNTSYVDMLDKVMERITTEHSEELASVLYDSSAEMKLKGLIARYINIEHFDYEEGIGVLTNRMYEDMAGISFIKGFLDDPDIEEININGPKEIWLVYPTRKVRSSKTFNSTEECVNIIKKMARMGNMILDAADPHGDSYIRKGVRLIASISPVVDADIGAVCSIRKQKPSNITRENLIEFGTASELELDFLKYCIAAGVSVAIAGSTGSGKTADMNYILSTVPDTVRIYTIEDTKELMLDKFDEHGKRINDIVQMYTQESARPITMDDLLRDALRYHPTIIVPAEMRGAEAKTAVEAGRTGHVIISSLHANGCKEAYDRILTMYLMADSTLSEDRILSMIVDAFPIMVFKRQLLDGSRKYMEIFEALGVRDGKVYGNTLFAFETSHVEREGETVTRIDGEHLHKCSISARLRDEFKVNGLTDEVIRQFYWSGKEGA